MKPRIFLGSSVQQEKLLQALNRGLQDITDVHPGRPCSSRCLDPRSPRRAHADADFNAFLSPTTTGRSKAHRPRPPHRTRRATTSSSKPVCSVVCSDMRRTFILHARGAKLPTDLLGRTTIRYDPAPRRRSSARSTRPSEEESRPRAGSAVSKVTRGSSDHDEDPARYVGRLLLSITRDRVDALDVAGRRGTADGGLTTRYRR